VTADYFDEPDDPDLDPDVQERYIVLDEEEEVRKKEKKILGIFPRRKKTGNGSQPSTPLPPGASDGSGSRAGTPAIDDDDLPPREEEAISQLQDEDGQDGGDIGGGGKARRTASEEAAAAEAAAMRAIPEHAGFDFAAISKELGKDIDLHKLRDPGAHYAGSPVSPRVAPVVPAPAPERTGSAPLPVPPSPSPSTSFPPAPVRSASTRAPEDEDEDAGGDIGGPTTAVRGLAIDMPAWGASEGWGQPSARLTSPSAPAAVAAPSSSSSSAASVFGFNAWSKDSSSPAAPSGSFGPDGMRAAPPARPHPANITNPFAGAWGDKEKMTMENPW
jgi:hypothetical protein